MATCGREAAAGQCGGAAEIVVEKRSDARPCDDCLLQDNRPRPRRFVPRSLLVCRLVATRLGCSRQVAIRRNAGVRLLRRRSRGLLARADEPRASDHAAAAGAGGLDGRGVARGSRRTLRAVARARRHAVAASRNDLGRRRWVRGMPHRCRVAMAEECARLRLVQQPRVSRHRGAQWEVARLLRERLKVALDAAGIDFPQGAPAPAPPPLAPPGPPAAAPAAPVPPTGPEPAPPPVQPPP